MGVSVERPGRGPVRVTIPAKDAYDLERFQNSVATILDELGCPACCSGFDITFLHERDFIFRGGNQLKEFGRRGLVADEPVPSPARKVNVALDRSVAFEISSVQKAVARVADILGCPACCSGFDIAFQHELTLVVDKNLDVHGSGPRF